MRLHKNIPPLTTPAVSYYNFPYMLIDANIVGDVIKKHRLESGETLSSLASYLGIDKGNLSKFENGKLKPPVEILNKIA